MATSAIKSSEEPPPQRISFDKLSFDQKMTQITAYILRLLPPLERYCNLNCIMEDTTELDETERHFEYLIQADIFIPEKKVG